MSSSTSRRGRHVDLAALFHDDALDAVAVGHARRLEQGVAVFVGREKRPPQRLQHGPGVALALADARRAPERRQLLRVLLGVHGTPLQTRVRALRQRQRPQTDGRAASGQQRPTAPPVRPLQSLRPRTTRCSRRTRARGRTRSAAAAPAPHQHPRRTDSAPDRARTAPGASLPDTPDSARRARWSTPPRTRRPAPAAPARAPAAARRRPPRARG